MLFNVVYRQIVDKVCTSLEQRGSPLETNLEFHLLPWVKVLFRGLSVQVTKTCDPPIITISLEAIFRQSSSFKDGVSTTFRGMYVVMQAMKLATITIRSNKLSRSFETRLVVNNPWISTRRYLANHEGMDCIMPGTGENDEEESGYCRFVLMTPVQLMVTVDSTGEQLQRSGWLGQVVPDPHYNLEDITTTPADQLPGKQTVCGSKQTLSSRDNGHQGPYKVGRDSCGAIALLPTEPPDILCVDVFSPHWMDAVKGIPALPYLDMLRAGGGATCIAGNFVEHGLFGAFLQTFNISAEENEFKTQLPFGEQTVVFRVKHVTIQATMVRAYSGYLKEDLCMRLLTGFMDQADRSREHGGEGMGDDQEGCIIPVCHVKVDVDGYVLSSTNREIGNSSASSTHSPWNVPSTAGTPGKAIFGSRVCQRCHGKVAVAAA